MLKQIKKAAQTGSKVTMIYLTESQLVSQRTVQIFAYTNDKMIGYCYMRSQIRTYNIRNILALEPVNKRMEAYI